MPQSLETCPNCEAAPRSALKKVAAAAGLVALVASGCSAPMPVYGIPCTSRQLDGGNNGCIGDCSTYLDDGGVPARDPQNSCYKPDGGTP